jgi:hypothetical protein
MASGLWHAACSCGWHSRPSADLAEQTDELDQHLRVVVISEQRPTRTSRAATSAALQVVDHTLLLGGLVVALVLAVPALVRRA